jgi:NADH-quinone oxidoreductase subunit H
MNYIYEPAQLIQVIRGYLYALASWMGVASIWGEWVGALIVMFVLFAFCALAVMVLVYAERKIAGHMQARIGPMRVGWHGILQVVADTIKLILKETEIPANADRIVYRMAPYVVFTAGFLALIVLPLDRDLVPVHLNVGLIYILAVMTPSVIGILMAGWSSGNKYSLLGGMRSAAQMISYEVPLVLSLLGVVMLGRTLDLQALVAAQKIPYIVYQPVAFLIFLVSAVAESNRNPFDIPEAESELTAGFHTEYGGIRFAYFFLAEYVNMFVLAALGATLFLGGWRGPVLPGWCWFLAKTGAILFVFFWFRWTFPRLRADQLMGLAWKVLTPLAFINILITGLMLI